MFQGLPNVPPTTFPGDEISYANYNHAQIASDFSGATIDSVGLTINNQHSWYNSGMYLVLGYADGSGDHSTGHAYWTTQGVTNSFDVSSALNGQIKTLLAIKLGPGGSSLYNYGYYQGGAGQGGPRLNVEGHIGSAGNFTAGGGSNGKVIVSYQSSTVMVGALSPAAGTDANGNAFAAGYTGNVQDFTPGSNPSTVETWHNFSYAGTWSTRTNYNGRYKLLAETNQVRIEMSALNSGTVSGTSQITTAVPAAYRPTRAQPLVCGWFGTGTPTASPSCEMKPDGTMSIFNAVTGTNLVQVNGVYSLD
jgi:hypothetical protein